jgi:predicted nucleic acid-binding protein
MGLVLFDTNILIDHTAGIIEATRELSGYDDAAISAINWMEVACALTSRLIITRDPDGFGGRQNPHVRVPYKNTHGVITDVLPLPE